MNDACLFISDCHLEASRPEVGAALIDFIGRQAGEADRLYILGDLFEVWLGDDDPAPEHRQVIDALRGLARHKRVFFMAGNRDFLLGEDLARSIGLTLLVEPELLDLGGRRVALLHGDTLCTDDQDYQAFRAMVRDPAWQQAFLARPLAERKQIAARLRSDSIDAMAQKSSEIMDVNPQAVSDCFAQHRADTILHGHTHRPAVHTYPGGRRRIVLGDWNPGPSYASWFPEEGFRLQDPRT